MFLNHYIHWNNNKIFKDGKLLYTANSKSSHQIAIEVYDNFKLKYSKFYKMDILSKIAFLATELLNPDYTEINKENIGVVLSTHSGSMTVDKKFEESRKNFASPALFVYTLPNIMLGEISIRHGFKGEQMCTIEKQFNPEWFRLYVSDLLKKRATDACVFGHIEAISKKIEVIIFWATRLAQKEDGIILSEKNLKRLLVV